MISSIEQFKKHTLLFTALILSLGIHFIGFMYFYIHPILLHNPWKSLFGLSSATPNLLGFQEDDFESIQKNQQIADSFQQLLVFSSHLKEPSDLTQLPQGIPLSPSSEQENAIEIPSEGFRSASIEDKLSYEPLSQIELPAFVDAVDDTSLLLSEKNMDPIVSTPIIIDPFTTEWTEPPVAMEEMAPSPFSAALEHIVPETTQPGVSFPEETRSLALEETADSVHLNIQSKPSLEKILPKEFISEEAISPPLILSPPPTWDLENRTLPQIASAQTDISNYTLPDLATATEWNTDFDIKLQFSPKAEGPGYIFTIELSPNFDVSQYRLKQNFHFILDRSSSVEKHRFAVFKRAVLKALSSLQPEESFNIYFVDKKITMMSPTPIAYSMKAIHAAESFMEKQEAGGLFASNDIYSSLEKILSHMPQEKVVNTAILLTDGKTSLSPSKQQHILKEWIVKNNSHLSIYTGAIGRNNDLVMLDLLSSVSGGKLLYSDTHASFPRKLAKLILDLHDPIAQNLKISAIPTHSHAQITLFPDSPHIPALYSHKPYLIMGEIDDPCSFDLLIQGKHQDQWISIKKRISFVEGEKTQHSLEKRWNGTQAHALYSKFLKEGKIAHLQEAKEILKTAESGMNFE